MLMPCHERLSFNSTVLLLLLLLLLWQRKP
jgi:hypothetical protein